MTTETIPDNIKSSNLYNNVAFFKSVYVIFQKI